MQLNHLAFTCVALSFLTACEGALRSEVRSIVAQRGRVLREWNVSENEDRMLIREGNRITEYRIGSFTAARSTGATSEVLYSFDSVINVCYGAGGVVIPCEKLVQDPDIGPYLRDPEFEKRV